MANIINGTDTGSGGLITSGDSSDELQLQTAETTAITIDSSQNVGVGTTTPGARIEATASGAAVQILNRTTSDGNILEFEKSGTTVGSIGTPFTGELYIEASGANSSGLLFTSGNSVQPRKNSAADDGNISIGTSGNRFKDLYLSGSVYLGGTTSANALDDYEEGTFTPILVGASTNPSSVSYVVQTGIYTKIGNMVTVWVRLRVGSFTGGTGLAMVGGLPFTSNSSMSMAGAAAYNNTNFPNQEIVTATIEMASSNTAFYWAFYAVDNGAFSDVNLTDLGNDAEIRTNFSYIV